MKGKFLDFADSGGGDFELYPGAPEYADAAAVLTDIGAAAALTSLLAQSASATQTQGQGAISSSAPSLFVQYTTVAVALDACTLPTAALNRQLRIKNDGVATLQVFPASGANFVGLAANAATTIPAGESRLFIGQSSTVWNIL